MLYYITGGMGFAGCVIAVILIILLSVKGKSRAVPTFLFIVFFLLFMGSGFCQFTGLEFSLPFGGAAEEPASLTGEWKQTNTESDGAFQGIYLTDSTIEIYWVSDGGSTTALYWAGSYIPPEEEQPKKFTWTSENDISRTAASPFASGAETMEFTYKNGKLSYSANAFGLTASIEAEKLDWGYSPKMLPAAVETESASASKSNEPVEELLSGTLGDYDVAVKEAVLSQDADGDPAIIITSSWTNNSEATINASSALYFRAFQDGVEISAAQMDAENSSYKDGSTLTNLRPGASTDIQLAFALSNTGSVIEFEMSALPDFSDNVLLQTFDPSALR